MLRNHWEINQRDVTNLKKFKRTAAGNVNALQELLAHELKLQREADWEQKNEAGCRLQEDDEKINYAINQLNIVSSYNSYDDYQFAKRWGINNKETAPWWCDFIANFSNKIAENNGEKLLHEYKTKFGLQSRSMLSTVNQSFELDANNAADNLQQFIDEIEYWNEKNLLKIFLSYLASCKTIDELEKAKIKITEHIIPGLVKGMINVAQKSGGKSLIDADQLIKKLDDKIVKIKLILSAGKLSEGEEAEHADIIQMMDEAKNPSVSDSSEYTELFNGYVDLLNEIHGEWKEAKNTPVKVAVRSTINYVASGIAVGSTMALAIAAALIFAGVCPVAGLVLLGVTTAVLGASMLGGIAGYHVKKYRDAQDEASLNSTIHVYDDESFSFAKTCTTLLIALGIGVTSISPVNASPLAAPDTTAPISQTDDDQDDEDEVDTLSARSAVSRAAKS